MSQVNRWSASIDWWREDDQLLPRTNERWSTVIELGEEVYQSIFLTQLKDRQGL